MDKMIQGAYDSIIFAIDVAEKNSDDTVYIPLRSAVEIKEAIGSINETLRKRSFGKDLLDTKEP